MLIIKVKPEENIERALKRYKRKHKNTKQIPLLRSKKHFTKKSTKRREEIAKAKYREAFNRSIEI
ncbi:MAG: 30S ribosomal protein S21 [Flavobacteriaceae bacterium]|nr:30S ribosomal protein S21 [Flavobacteriaceae bacterium]